MAGNALIGILMLLLPVFFRFPFIGLLVYFWFDLASPHTVFWNSLSSLPLALVIGAVTFAGVVFSWKGPKQLNVFAGLMILYVAWFSVGHLQALVPDAAAFKFDRSLKVFLPLALFSMMIVTRARIELVLWMFVGTIAASVIRGAAVTVSWGGGGYAVIGPIGSFIEDRSTFATVMVMSIPLVFYLARRSLNAPRGMIRYALYVFPLLALISLVGSYSRAGLLALGATALVAMALAKHRVILLAAAVVTGFALFHAAPQEWVERMQTTQTYQQDDSAMGRLQSWRFAIDMAKHRLTGGGFGVFRLNLSDVNAGGFVDSHSWFFEVLGEQGVPGVLIICALYATVFWRLAWVGWKVRVHADLEWAGNLARMLLLAMVALLTGGFFVGISSYSFTYLIPMVAIGLANLVRKDLADRSAVEAAAGRDDKERTGFVRRPTRGLGAPATRG